MSAPFYCSSNKGEYVLTIRKLALVAIPAVLAAVGTSSIRVAAQVSGPAAAGPVVVTKDGPVRGLFANGVNAYLGIPYAAPPVGDLRWRPPAPPAHHGLIDATQFANTCPQVTELGAGSTSGARNRNQCERRPDQLVEGKKSTRRQARD